MILIPHPCTKRRKQRSKYLGKDYVWSLILKVPRLLQKKEEPPRRNKEIAPLRLQLDDNHPRRVLHSLLGRSQRLEFRKQGHGGRTSPECDDTKPGRTVDGQNPCRSISISIVGQTTQLEQEFGQQQENFITRGDSLGITETDPTPPPCPYLRFQFPWYQRNHRTFMAIGSEEPEQWTERCYLTFLNAHVISRVTFHALPAEEGRKKVASIRHHQVSQRNRHKSKIA